MSNTKVLYLLLILCIIRSQIAQQKHYASKLINDYVWR
ncbi:hypothetical protein D082_10370 [Synechocystis sp. PCC 6714]|nr:hypothetical protein D082_10370 [Synechocystis sp. PCC 6714]